MLQQATSVQFTVGKLDAGMAILLSADHHLIEFPATILPEGVKNGSIINITIERNMDQEKIQKDELMSLQEEIYKEFSRTPLNPIISIRAITQTSITVQWEPLELFSADLRGIDIYRNGQKLGIQVASNALSAKCTGLSIDQEYAIHIVMRTSAGDYKSNIITTKTHTLENLSGINVCFGTFVPGTEEQIDELIELLERVGATYSEELTLDNTHVICNVTKGPKYEKAKEWNIPVVKAEFLRQCESQGRILAAHGYYVSN